VSRSWRNSTLVARARRAAASVLAAVAFGACHFPWSSPPAPTPNPSQVTEAVYALMLCQECTSGELSNVIALGGATIPPLREILLTGPPQAHIDRLSATLRTVAPQPTRLPPNQATIALQISDFDSMYRVRAADALGAIGGSGAKQALCRGHATQALRPEVYRMIDSAVARVGGPPCP
jgi:hypothetical protein